MDKEYRFHPDRKWRFDFALPDKMIGIEYEGLNSEKVRPYNPEGVHEGYGEVQRGPGFGVAGDSVHGKKLQNSITGTRKTIK